MQSHSCYKVAMPSKRLPSSHITMVLMANLQDPLPLNSAVIVRVWPRPYSVWEDNPEDPEAIDGYFLLDVNEKQPQDRLRNEPHTHTTHHDDKMTTESSSRFGWRFFFQKNVKKHLT